MEHRGRKLYKVYINYDPVLTLTYFTARTNLVTYTFVWGKLLQNHLMGNHHFQTSSPLKPLDQSKPNFMFSILRKGEGKFI